MARHATLAAAFFGAALGVAPALPLQYIAVPGGFTCPRDCLAATTSAECAEGGKALGLPCGSTKAVVISRTNSNGDFAAIVTALGNPSFRGSVILAAGTDVSLVGTEMVALSYVSASQLQQVDFSNRTDTVQAEISSGWIAAPVGDVTLTFKGVCSVTEQNAKAEMGGCSWRKGTGLHFNSYIEGGRADIHPWEQIPGGKALIAADGANAFRICKCTQLPQFVAVMHSKCAPSCRRDYDPCSQHLGAGRCKKIETWEKCKTAGTELNWVPLIGDDATPVGSGSLALAAWNGQFTDSMWLQNRGTSAAITPALCTGSGAAVCLRNPIWQQSGGVSEWTAAGLTGGKDRWYEYMNDGATSFPVDAIDNVLWKDFKTQVENVLAPPPVNFLADPVMTVIPAGTQWSAQWTAPALFLADGWGQVSASSRPGGCTFKHATTVIPSSFFFPWAALKLNGASNNMTSDLCCPPGTTFGTDCFVESCTAQPCLEWGSGENCYNQASEVEDTFAMCECSKIDVTGQLDECIFLGQPCGAGQTCTDPDLGSYDGQYQCTCINGGSVTMGGPSSCPDDSQIRYVAKPAGRDCGECDRVVSKSQCEAAATQLGLSDMSATSDSFYQRRTRPCGCHYSEHGQICADSNGECLRYNMVEGDAVYNGCDAYEPADAHDFLICACGKDTALPKYVAAPVVVCPATCDPIVSKEDCRKGAEFIGMHLAVHEEQEALLLLEGAAASSKLAPYHTYVGLDGQTYQHNDNGLGDVVGDGPLAQPYRPPGCHYRRRFDADVLPGGSTVNWPHLLFNPMLSSTIAASTQDMLICRCPDAFPLAQTPAPTATNAAYAAAVGFVQKTSGGQSGECQQTDGYSQQGNTVRATFQTCADMCLASSGCEGTSWFLDPSSSYDTEGLGVCTHLMCSNAPLPCPGITVLAGAGQECYAKGTPTPAPTPVPTGLNSPPCTSYCCMHTVRGSCCTDPMDCDSGTSTGYCAWTPDNKCQRNSYDRGGQCAEIEILFNASAWFGSLSAAPSPADFAMMQGQVAVEANQLTGSTAESIVPATSSVWSDLATQQVKVWLSCTGGGCGSLDEIAQSLCPAGTQVLSGSPAMWSGADLNGQVTCLKTTTGGLTEQFPTAALASMQPTQVQARQCGCAPELVSVDFTVTNTMNFVEKKVTTSEIRPAYTNSPQVDGLCDVPDYLQGMTHFRMEHSVPDGTTFTFSCPAGCGVCDLFLFHYHETPCSAASNGRFPAVMPADGWQPGGCSPKLCEPGTKWSTVGFRKQVMAGTTVTTPPVETSCMSYFGLFAGPGVFCEDNVLQDEALCNSAGGLCKWSGSECVSEWCPQTTAGTKPICQQIGDAECPTSPPAGGVMM